MKFFQAHIERFSSQLAKDRGLELLAVAVVQYPLFQIRAYVEEIADESTLQLDLFILRFLSIWGSISIEELSLMMGIAINVAKWRLKELENTEYVERDGMNYTLTAAGRNLLEAGAKNLKRKVNRDFVIDGISLKPTRLFRGSSNQKSFSRHVILFSGQFEVNEEKLMRSDFRPDIVHEIPDDKIVENILSVSLDLRKEFGIPTGLLNVLQYEPIKCTHPLAIGIVKDNVGNLRRLLFDCCGSKAEDLDPSLFEKQFIENVNKLYIMIQSSASTDTNRPRRTVLRNSWHINQDLRSPAWLMAGEPNSPAVLIRQHWRLPESVVLQVELTNDGISWDVNTDCVSSLRAGSSFDRFLAQLARGNAYIYQHETTGVWLMFVKLNTTDPDIVELIELYKLLSGGAPEIESLLDRWTARRLRSLLFTIGDLSLREKIDIYCFMRDVNKGIEG